jgi:hypothetical protein
MTFGGWLLMISTDLMFTVSLICCLRLVLLPKAEREEQE